MAIPLVAYLSLLLGATIEVVPSTSAWAFSPSLPSLPHPAQHRALYHGCCSSCCSKSGGRHLPHRFRSTALFGGVGIANNYTWREEQYEIDVVVPVPARTRARDLLFKATPRSVDLRLRAGNAVGGEEFVLLDGSRQMRGRVSVDGTYWAISDGERDSTPEDEGADTNERQVTVTIEKMISDPQDQFEVVEYDWGGVYPDDEGEVRERTYDEPEELDVREYAASLGVDIDNINMSMVDKTMFGSGLNMTRSTLDELNKAGYVNEVTQQGDGMEYIADEEGSAVPFSPLGDAIGEDELSDANLAGGGGGMASIRSQLPFIDTHSQWHKSMPVEEARGVDGVPLQSADKKGGTATSEKEVGQVEANTDVEKEGGTDEEDDATSEEDAADTIDLLTVKRLKEILRKQNLKVSGNKQELRDRLRAHVNSLLSGDKD